MNCNNLLIISCVIIFLLIILLFIFKSNFKGAYTDNYENEGCMHDNREIPQGSVPGSWLGLSSGEKKNLELFIKNSSVYK